MLQGIVRHGSVVSIGITKIENLGTIINSNVAICTGIAGTRNPPQLGFPHLNRYTSLFDLIDIGGLSDGYRSMLSSIRAPLLRVCLATVPLTFRRPLAIAAETFKPPSSTSIPLKSPSFLENEPQKPSFVTEIPGPKSRAAKEALGKIQDVSLLLSC
jgi:hypothetical protein